MKTKLQSGVAIVGWMASMLELPTYERIYAGLDNLCRAVSITQAPHTPASTTSAAP